MITKFEPLKYCKTQHCLPLCCMPLGVDARRFVSRGSFLLVSPLFFFNCGLRLSLCWVWCVWMILGVANNPAFDKNLSKLPVWKLMETVLFFPSVCSRFCLTTGWYRGESSSLLLLVVVNGPSASRLPLPALIIMAKLFRSLSVIRQDSSRTKIETSITSRPIKLLQQNQKSCISMSQITKLCTLWHIIAHNKPSMSSTEHVRTGQPKQYCDSSRQ